MLTVFLCAAGVGSATGTTPDQEVRKRVQDYFNLRYKILSSLEYDAGIGSFISADILNSRDLINEADVLETIVGYRKAQINDLRFDRYQLSLEFENVKIEGTQVGLILKENYELYFKCAPTVRNQATVEHVMMLGKTGGKWLIIKDDYSDPEGIKQALNRYFLENHVSKPEAKCAIMTQSENLAAGRSIKLESLAEGLKESAGEKLAVFYADKNIAFAEGKAQKIDKNSRVKPFANQGELMLPTRFVTEMLGGKIEWIAAENQVKITAGDHTALYMSGGSSILLEDRSIALETPIQNINGRTFLPANVLAEILDVKVYSSKEGLVILSSNEVDGMKNSTAIQELTAFFGALYTKADFPRMDGSTATYPLSMELGKELLGLDETGVKGFITHKTTHNAYVNLINGSADIIFVTQPSPDETALAKEKGVELEIVPVCKEGFVFLVNKENPVNSLTVEQVQGIYQGRIKNWKEVGGEDAEMIAYQREANSGSQTLMENTVMKGLKLAEAPREVLIYGMGELIDRVADFSNAKNALGYSVYYYATTMYSSRNVKLLAINDVVPDKKTIGNDTYSFTTGYYAVLRKSEPEGSSARRLWNWLMGTEGQSVVDRAGFVPVK